MRWEVKSTYIVYVMYKALDLKLGLNKEKCIYYCGAKSQNNSKESKMWGLGIVRNGDTSKGK